jgi:hypothetical protein
LRKKDTVGLKTLSGIGRHEEEGDEYI